MRALIENNDLILMEGSVVERLHRLTDVPLHNALLTAPLIYHDKGARAMRRIYESYIETAEKGGLPFMMCTPTWRSDYERVYASEFSRNINRDAAAFSKKIIKERKEKTIPIYLGGILACKNDAYNPEESLGVLESEKFHAWQINELAEGNVDYLIAETLPAVDEALGIALAAEKTNLPYFLSFVINKQGLILDKTPLTEAVDRIDQETKTPPAGYMVNCAYPTFLKPETQPASLFKRLVGYVANASSLDHDELENADEMKREPVNEWGDAMLELNRSYGIKILGGCCGACTDHLEYLVCQSNTTSRTGENSERGADKEKL